MTTGGPQGPPPGAAGGGGAGGAAAPSDEEVRAALEEQMRRLSVQDVLVQTVVTLVNLGARKLGLTAPAEEAGGERTSPDLEQGRQAIEATRALLPLVSGDIAPIRDAVSQLQVAYAQLAQAAQGPGGRGQPGGPEPGAPGEARGGEPAGAPPGSAGGPAPSSPPPGGPSPAQAPATDPEREKARSKIWTPPGA